MCSGLQSESLWPLEVTMESWLSALAPSHSRQSGSQLPYSQHPQRVSGFDQYQGRF